MRRIVRLWLGIALLLAATRPVAAQTTPQLPSVAGASIQSGEQALEQDAAAMADRLGVSPEEALHQLRLQEASVQASDLLADRYADRLAGIAIDHGPPFRIAVLLTGDEPEADQTVEIGGEAVTVTFRTGARATRTGIIQAISSYQAAIRASLIVPAGMGLDQRSGELVILVNHRDLMREGSAPLRDRLAALTHVPVRLRVVDEPSLDLAGIEGGTRLVGGVPNDTRRYLCTAAFVVTDGTRTALTTAAHCPDEVTARDDQGHDETLPFVGQWGWGNQDVQINASAEPLPPTFYADTNKTLSRAATASRSRAETRAGEVVCHRGERTGHSCSEVELTDFAPAGDLCGGPCLPTWTTVAGPTCKGGDSGSPVFLGTTAFGILKGGSYRADGSCAFYFYMSVDYLPAGWRLLTSAAPPDPGRAPAPG